MKRSRKCRARKQFQQWKIWKVCVFILSFFLLNFSANIFIILSRNVPRRFFRDSFLTSGFIKLAKYSLFLFVNDITCVETMYKI